MIAYDVIEAAYPSAEQLAEFKNFASVNVAATDGLLTSMLKSAMLAVGEWEDVSLLVCTCRVSATGREYAYEPVHLFGTPNEVTEMVDGGGYPIEGRLAGRDVILDDPAKNIFVTYTTRVDEGALGRLLPKVYRYALALYDGESSPVLNRILTER